MTMPMMIQTLLIANRAGDISTGGQSASGKTGVNGVFAALMRQTQNTGNAPGTQAQSSPVALKGHALVSYLKKNLQSSGVSLDQAMADDSAMAAIEKVLLGAGFEAGQVKNLLGELKTNAGGNGVRVSTLFEGISRLTEPSAATSKTAYLEISALPHIETLLAKFGLTPDQIKSALSGAKVERKGIDAERLAAELKQLRQGAGSKKDISREDAEPEQILSMMQQIGLTIPINPAGPLNLESLVSALQKFSARNSSSLDKEASAMASANKTSQAVLNHLKQHRGPSISAGDGRLSPDRFAAELEIAAGLRDGAASQLKQKGDWDLFVRNIKSVSTGKTSASELRTSPLLSGMAASVPQSEISNSLFSDPAFFQPVSGKRGLVEKGSNRQIKSGLLSGLTSIEGSDLLKAETSSHRDNAAATHSTVSQPVSGKRGLVEKGSNRQIKSGLLSGLTSIEGSDLLKAETSSHRDNAAATHSTVSQPVSIKGNSAEKGVNGQNLAGSKTGQSTAGSPDATKAGWADAIIAGVSAEKNLEEAVVTAAAKVSEPGGETLQRTGKTVRKSSDSAVPLLGDGINRRAETLDSTPLSTPDRPAGREFPQYLLDQVSRQILRSRLANESEILIQLKPATLGRLKMSIENSADGLKVSIIVESQAARDMLLSNSGDLKTALMDQGVRLDKINVETQADFNQSMADTRQGSEGSGGRKGFTGGTHIRVETAASAIEPWEIAQNGSSVLNLVA